MLAEIASREVILFSPVVKKNIPLSFAQVSHTKHVTQGSLLDLIVRLHKKGVTVQILTAQTDLLPTECPGLVVMAPFGPRLAEVAAPWLQQLTKTVSPTDKSSTTPTMTSTTTLPLTSATTSTTAPSTSVFGRVGQFTQCFALIDRHLLLLGHFLPLTEISHCSKQTFFVGPCALGFAAPSFVEYTLEMLKEAGRHRYLSSRFSAGRPDLFPQNLGETCLNAQVQRFIATCCKKRLILITEAFVSHRLSENKVLRAIMMKVIESIRTQGDFRAILLTNYDFQGKVTTFMETRECHLTTKLAEQCLGAEHIAYREDVKINQALHQRLFVGSLSSQTEAQYVQGSLLVGDTEALYMSSSVSDNGLEIGTATSHIWTLVPAPPDHELKSWLKGSLDPGVLNLEQTSGICRSRLPAAHLIGTIEAACRLKTFLSA